MNWKKYFSAVVISIGGLGAGIPRADVSEYEVKAAFLLNFSKFVEWPTDSFSSTSEPFVVGVLGKNPFGSALAHAWEGKTVGDRTIVEKKFPSGADPASYKACHILFIGRSESDAVSEILKSLTGSRALTVSDIDGFAEKGGMFGFVAQDGKIKLRLNIAAAKKAGLAVSAKLQQLSKIVE